MKTEIDDFRLWLNQIDFLSKVNGYFGESYTDATGHDYWRTAFGAGKTAEEEFADDANTIRSADELMVEFDSQTISAT